MWAPLYSYDLTWIPACLSNHIHYKLSDESTYPLPKFNGINVEVWEWIENRGPCSHVSGVPIHRTMNQLCHKCQDLLPCNMQIW